MEELNIFEKLNERGIIYAVIVSKSKMKKARIDIVGTEYCIVAHRKDIVKHTFSFRTDHTKENIVVRELNRDEIAIFRELSNDFKLVFNTPELGRVYETKTASFRQYYKNGLITNNKNLI